MAASVRIRFPFLSLQPRRDNFPSSLGHYASGSRRSEADSNRIRESQRSCREEFEILCGRTFDRFERDRGIESGQPATVRYRKREKIDVGKLAMTLNVIPAEPSEVAYADRVRPENMLTIRTEGTQTCGCILDRGAPARVGRSGQDADQRVFRERTSRPSATAIASEPV